jgi:hypothetical protein
MSTERDGIGRHKRLNGRSLLLDDLLQHLVLGKRPVLAVVVVGAQVSISLDKWALEITRDCCEA